MSIKSTRLTLLLCFFLAFSLFYFFHGGTEKGPAQKEKKTIKPAPKWVTQNWSMAPITIDGLDGEEKLTTSQFHFVIQIKKTPDFFYRMLIDAIMKNQKGGFRFIPSKSNTYEHALIWGMSQGERDHLFQIFRQKVYGQIYPAYKPNLDALYLFNERIMVRFHKHASADQQKAFFEKHKLTLQDGYGLGMKLGTLADEHPKLIEAVNKIRTSLTSEEKAIIKYIYPEYTVVVDYLSPTREQ